jgi:hypothetical protein
MQQGGRRPIPTIRVAGDAENGSLSAKAPKNEKKIAYPSTQGGAASFGYTFNEDTELTGYMKVQIRVATKSAEDMDLFVTIRKFAGPYDPRSEIGKPLEAVLGQGAIAVATKSTSVA